MGEHLFETSMAGAGEAVVAARRAGGRGLVADGDELVGGKAGKDGVEGGFGKREVVEFGQALKELVAVEFFAAEGDEDEELEEPFADLGDPGAGPSAGSFLFSHATTTRCRVPVHRTAW